MFKDNISKLLERVGSPTTKGTKLYAIVISFRALEHLDRLPAILSDFHRQSERLKGVLGASAVQISETDFSVLSEQTEYSALGAVADLKMLLLKLIGSHDAQVFGVVDQSRLVRVFELPRQRNEFVTLLYEERNRRVAPGSGKTLRTLTPPDIPHITAVLDAMSRQDFVDKFIKSQPIAVVKKGNVPAVALNEYFVSIGLIQQRIVPGANVLLNRPTFNLLAHELDQRVIDCLMKRAIDGRMGSFNFSLDTLFTRKFEELGASGYARNLIFELRVSDIFENFAKFLAARKLLRSLNARIAVDGVLPSMLGALKPAHLECEFVKIYFDDSLGIRSGEAEKEIAEIGKSGSRVVLARIESLNALHTGMDLGVDVFQGFYVDALLKDTGERDKFMAA